MFRAKWTSAALVLLSGGVLASAILAVEPASAGLGRSFASVDVDRIHLGARLQSTWNGIYTVHAMSLPNGGRVKEFTRADGKVFAVSWHAPGRPDLRQLLGEHFEAVQPENTARVGRRLRVPIGVNRSDIVVQTGGHPGAFWGFALLPQMQPTGFVASDMQ